METRKQQSLKGYVKLMRAAESVNRRINAEHVLAGRLTMSQFAVLEALYAHGGQLKQVEIAKKILKTPGNLTLVIDNLVRASLVTRTVSAADRRANAIELTLKGSTLISEVFPMMADAITDAFDVLDSQELNQLSELLKKLGTGK
jgi:MarR family 2-MHQ and catechol resistance regulon transcriptional repressor